MEPATVRRQNYPWKHSQNAQKCKIVELCFFDGLTVEQTADMLAISAMKMKREWSMAKACLHGELRTIHDGFA